jgi:hypothetical protein
MGDKTKQLLLFTQCRRNEFQKFNPNKLLSKATSNLKKSNDSDFQGRGKNQNLKLPQHGT